MNPRDRVLIALHEPGYKSEQLEAALKSLDQQDRVTYVRAAVVATAPGTQGMNARLRAELAKEWQQ